MAGPSARGLSPGEQRSELVRQKDQTGRGRHFRAGRTVTKLSGKGTREAVLKATAARSPSDAYSFNQISKLCFNLHLVVGAVAIEPNVAFQTSLYFSISILIQEISLLFENFAFDSHFLFVDLFALVVVRQKLPQQPNCKIYKVLS